jgi:hypothetical protein
MKQLPGNSELASAIQQLFQLEEMSLKTDPNASV